MPDYDDLDDLDDLDSDIDNESDGDSKEQNNRDNKSSLTPKERVARKRRSNNIEWQGNPNWRGMVSWYIKYGGISLVAILVLLILNKTGVLAMGFVVLISIVILAILFALGHLKRRMTVYTVTPSRVIMKTGIFNVVKEQAPLDKINNIIINRTLMERIMGIGDLQIDTANDQRDLMDWWGVKDPYRIERLIDDLRDDMTGRDNMDF